MLKFRKHWRRHTTTQHAANSLIYILTCSVQWPAGSTY